MQYALIIDNEVRELFDQPPVFHPLLEIAEVDDSVEVYFVRDGDSYVKPPVIEASDLPTAMPTIAELLDRIVALEAKVNK